MINIPKKKNISLTEMKKKNTQQPSFGTGKREKILRKQQQQHSKRF